MPSLGLNTTSLADPACAEVYTSIFRYKAEELEGLLVDSGISAYVEPLRRTRRGRPCTFSVRVAINDLYEACGIRDSMRVKWIQDLNWYRGHALEINTKDA